MASKAFSTIQDSPIGEGYQTSLSMSLGPTVVDREVRLERLASNDNATDAIVEAASNEDAISQALAVSAAIECGGQAENAVYVIGPVDRAVCKIGVSAGPALRLTELQTGCPDELKIHALFWSMDGTATGLENLCLRVANELGVRRRGEWVNLRPQQAAAIIATVISCCDAPYADSAMWLRNRARMRAAKAEVKESLRDEQPSYPHYK